MNKKSILTWLAATTSLAIAALGACLPVTSDPPAIPKNLGTEGTKSTASSATVIVAGGCFWCLEAQFELLKGVKDVESGYAGATGKADYSAVSSGGTGYAEAIKVTFDPKVISEADLLRIFFVSHDPTQLNRQGPDVGTQYRSAIFYRDEAEKKLAERIKAEISKEKLYDQPIVTTIEPVGNYVTAEAYHQDYYQKYEKASDAELAKMNSGYCAYVVSPKVDKFRKRFAHLLKSTKD